MKALLLEAPGRARVTDVPMPQPAAGEALVRVLAAGICGSDRHAFAGEHPVFSYPRIPGHEFAGEIVCAPANSDLQPGDLVVGDPALACGSCQPCRRGRPNICLNVAVCGVHRDGALAEFVALPAPNLHRIASGIGAQDAALAEPLGVGLQALRRGRLRPDETVAIVGAGPIGLSVLLATRALGARALVTELRRDRMEFAQRLGADAVAHADQASAAARKFGDDGFPLVIEAAGEPGAVRQALELAAPGGRVVLLGLIGQAVPVIPWQVIRGELEIIGSRMTNETIPEALRMMAEGALRPQAMCTHCFALERADEALKLASRAPEGVEKVIITMAPDG